MTPPCVSLESLDLQRTLSGAWNVIGRVKNISNESLDDTWVLVQLFDDHEEFLTFDEVPIPINPLPPEISSPFKMVFDGSLLIKKISIGFKSASGYPFPAMDGRIKKEWVDEESLEKVEGKEVSLKTTNEIAEEKIMEESIDLTLRTEEKVEEEVKVEVKEEEEAEVKAEITEEVKAEITAEITEEVKAEIITEEEKEVEWQEKGGEGERERETLEEEEEVFEEQPPFPWVEEFRNMVEIYDQKNRDIFSIWFESYRNEDGFITPIHSLLTILVYARFDQMGDSERALRNTQKVFRLIIKQDLQFEEIPLLEGTPFSPGENWTDLFHRAIPKFREVANRILEGKKWDARDLERLIQIVPYMSVKNSRMAVKRINELIPEVITIDFSETPILIGESLYRVAARLGVVDPNFDIYRGKNSMGDLKIQSFGSIAFSLNPTKIEEAMVRMGMKKEEGGHCFPIDPLCEGCLFEAFCPKLYTDYNPAEKGMKER